MKAKNNKMIQAIAYIAIGVLFCILQAGLLKWLITAVGVVLVVMGVFDAISKNYTSAVIKIVVGVLIALFAIILDEFVGIILMILGIVVIINGAKQLLDAIKPKNKNVKDLIIPIVTIVFGALLIASNWALVDWLFIIIGVLVALEGVLMLLGKK